MICPLRPRTAAAALVAAGLLGLVTVLGAAPAHATGYRYWSFWKWAAGSWAYQQQGPAVYAPPDGAVDGWRFAVSPDGGQDAARPAATGDFAAVCAATPARAGRKRVAVVLDFGTAADAPPGALPAGAAPPAAQTTCASVPATATSAEVLAAVAPPLRYDTGGILCAIAGYPKAGCGEAIGAAPAGGGSGPGLGLVAGGAVVAVLAAGAVRQARRRR